MKSSSAFLNIGIFSYGQTLHTKRSHQLLVNVFFYFHILYKVLEAGLTKLDTGYDLQQAKKGVKFME